ncbi:MAG: glycosyltransferase family 4 protein, partial [Lentisphaeria bacterium]
FRRYNKSVSFSPVPINPEEYLHETPDVRAKYGIDKKAFVFLSLGRIARIKGQDLAAEAFVQCAKDMPDAKLVFVGRSDYDPAMLKEMKEKLAQAGLTPRCVFTGMVPRDEVIGFLQQSSIHVIPVRFMNSGAVVVESWAGGIPVIQSDAVDPNLVEVGKNGYLFHSEKVAELAECMKKAYVEREKLGGYAQNGRKKVLQEFTYQHLIKLYNEVYEKLLV